MDGNQPEVVAKLRQCGMSVAVTSDVGEGFPDLVVGWRGVTALVEVKDPAQPPSKRKLTNDEEKFHREWKGSVIVAETFQDVLLAMQKLTM